jgi:CubicO group peptidase (beta-lactamase class C family)
LDRDFKHRNSTTPAPLSDGWDLATPSEVGLSPIALSAIHDELLRADRFVGALAFLVVKDGKLVFETYLRDPADRDRVHHLQSTTKSITSALYGMARSQGWMPGTDATFCSILPDKCVGLPATKQAITVEQLLTMRSGLAIDNSDFSMDMWVGQPKDPVRFLLDRPLYANPGEKYYYRDADPQLLGYALQRQAGRSEEAFARTALFSPMGITDYYWDHGAQGESMAAHGLHLLPRDLAKFGQLMLDQGRWNSEQLVPSDWCADATRHHVVPTDQPRFGYGYYFWIVPEAGGYSTWGHGGQYAFVVPGERLVMVLVSHPDTDPDQLHGGMLGDFVDLTRPLWKNP